MTTLGYFKIKIDSRVFISPPQTLISKKGLRSCGFNHVILNDIIWVFNLQEITLVERFYKTYWSIEKFRDNNKQNQKKKRIKKK